MLESWYINILTNISIAIAKILGGISLFNICFYQGSSIICRNKTIDRIRNILFINSKSLIKNFTNFVNFLNN